MRWGIFFILLPREMDSTVLFFLEEDNGPFAIGEDTMHDPEIWDLLSQRWMRQLIVEDSRVGFKGADSHQNFQVAHPLGGEVGDGWGRVRHWLKCLTT